MVSLENTEQRLFSSCDSVPSEIPEANTHYPHGWLSVYLYNHKDTHNTASSWTKFKDVSNFPKKKSSTRRADIQDLWQLKHVCNTVGRSLWHPKHSSATIGNNHASNSLPTV